jgi:CRISPR/Cas system-associated exonuclease Cas4 (RecB family)
MTLVAVAAALLLAAAFILLNIRRQRRLGGLPAGEVISADNAREDCPILVAHRYGLKGKPDALVRTPSGELIPVERKKKRAPSKGPYDGDLIQATAYCILVEEHYGHTPPFMRIQYADRWFDEPYTLHRKQWVLQICERVRAARRLSDCNRSHRKAAKCRNCGQRNNCGQEL